MQPDKQVLLVRSRVLNNSWLNMSLDSLVYALHLLCVLCDGLLPTFLLILHAMHL